MKSFTNAAQEILSGLSCNHSGLRECHEGCGHWSCPDCDLHFDEGAECDPVYLGEFDEAKP